MLFTFKVLFLKKKFDLTVKLPHSRPLEIILSQAQLFKCPPLLYDRDAHSLLAKKTKRIELPMEKETFMDMIRSDQSFLSSLPDSVKAFLEDPIKIDNQKISLPILKQTFQYLETSSSAFSEALLNDFEPTFKAALKDYKEETLSLSLSLVKKHPDAIHFFLRLLLPEPLLYDTQVNQIFRALFHRLKKEPYLLTDIESYYHSHRDLSALEKSLEDLWLISKEAQAKKLKEEYNVSLLGNSHFSDTAGLSRSKKILTLCHQSPFILWNFDLIFINFLEDPEILMHLFSDKTHLNPEALDACELIVRHLFAIGALKEEILLTGLRALERLTYAEGLYVLKTYLKETQSPSFSLHKLSPLEGMQLTLCEAKKILFNQENL